MLTEIRLQGFKCFRDHTVIPLRQLNLLTGVNGGGKSTTLQGLLMVHQSLRSRPNAAELQLNGSCTKIGNFQDLRNIELSRSQPVRLGLEFENGDDWIAKTFVLGDEDNEGRVAHIDKIEVEGQVANAPFEWNVKISGNDSLYLEMPNFSWESTGTSLSNLSWPPREYGSNVMHGSVNAHPSFKTLGFDPDSASKGMALRDQLMNSLQKLHYVSADRLGPQDYYVRKNIGDFTTVGSRGEHILEALRKFADKEVPERLCIEHSGLGSTHTVLDQAAAWLAKLFGGGNLQFSEVQSTLLMLTMNADGSKSRFHKPSNLGFGFSYALPILVAGLIAQPGEMLVVENPEAHLHPASQSRIADFLARVAAHGNVQVLIESHSDHVLNALRVALKSGLLDDPEQLNVLYFSRDETQKVNRIPVGADGSIVHWPPGFFDQSSDDLKRLHGV